MSIANEILRLQTAKADIKTAIENKGVTVGDGKIDTYAEKINEISGGEGDYEQGYNDGYAKAESENPLQYIYVKGFQWYKIDFPEGFDFVLNLLKKPDDCNAMLFGAKGIKTATISCDVEGTVAYAQMFRDCTVEIVDLTKFKPLPTTISYFAYYATKLKTILGAFDLSQCTVMTSAFAVANALEDIEFVPNTIKISINFSHSSKLTNASIQSIIDGLATVETAQTLTLHNNLKILQSQVDSANAKGWTVAGGTVVSEEEYNNG